MEVKMTKKQKLKEQQAFDAMVKNAVEFNQWQFRNLKPLTAEELQKHEDDLIKQFGKKGLNFILCQCTTSRLCQNQQNKKICQTPSMAPQEFLICGRCLFSWKVKDGLIRMDEQ